EHEQDRDHYEAEGERVDQQRDRPTERSAGMSPASRQDADADHARRADPKKLNLFDRMRGGALRRDLQQILGSDAAQRHLDELKTDRRHPPRRDESLLEP